MNNKQKTNWWIDILLLLSFLITFFMDITGLLAHQWIGIVSFAIAILHLLLHRKWVKSVSKRLFHKRSGKERVYFTIDAIILLGFSLIIISGVIMSTWLNLILPNYDVWRKVHILSSITTLIFVLIKLVLHLQWLEQTMRKLFHNTAPAQVQPVFIETNNAKRVGRREFLISLGVVSTASIIALATASKSLAEALTTPETSETGATATFAPESATSTPQATETSTATTQPSSTVVSPTQAPTLVETQPIATAPVGTESSCTVRCQGGCSYPGHCRRYTDANNNGLCDLGECL